METTAITVRILDKDYKIACPPQESEGLMLSAKRVDKEMRKVRESGKVLGTDRIAVIVALNLAYELLLHLSSTPSAQAESELRLEMQKLQSRLDLVLQHHNL
jgi:cell division protein ZapA